MSFENYSTSEVLRLANTLKSKSAEDRIQYLTGLPEPNRALLLHLGRYLKRREANVLLAQLKHEKKEYDESGPVYKTPFALRNITDPVERSFVIANATSYASTFGCTGGCEWCAVDAFTLKEPVATPLEQSEHFFMEFIRTVGDPRKVRKITFYADNDPFDDPAIVEFMTYIYRVTGATPSLSTTLPERGEESFKFLTAAAKRYKDLRALRAIPDEVGRLQEALAEFHVDTFRALNNLYRKVKRVKILKQVLGFKQEDIKKRIWSMEMLKKYALDPVSLNESDEEFKDIIATILAALKHYGLKPIDELNESEMENYLRLIQAKLEREEAELSAIIGLDDKFEKKYRDNIKPILENIESVLARFGLTCFDRVVESDQEAFAEIERVAENGERQLRAEGVPDVGEIRVSVIGRRAAAVKRLKDAGKYYFDYISRDGSAYSGRDIGTDGLYTLGKSRLKENSTYDSYMVINCMNGVEITPFALFNEVSGFATRDFPQGRILVPFEGLREGSELACVHTPLGEILRYVIVINERFFQGVIGDVPDHIHVYDGDHRVRRIAFDRSNYQVIEDVVVQENVTSVEQISSLNYYSPQVPWATI